MKKVREVLHVTATDRDGNDRSQYLKKPEVRLINNMLGDGLYVKEVQLTTVSAGKYKALFG